MGTSIGSLVFNFGANLSGFDRAMKKAQKNLKRFGKSMQRTGKSLTTGLTLPIIGFGAMAVKAFDAQQKAIAQVEAGLKSTGNQVGITSEKLQEMAADLQKTSIFGDEEILQGVTAQLLTFTNITGEQFERTQVAALDLATRLDGDLKSASIMLGKALNDPVANLSALSRAGIQFSEDQKTLINSLVETGDEAGAQTIILNELEKQYGGSAAAAAEAGLGPVQQLKNQFSDLTEQIGARLVPHIELFAKWITSLMERFDRLSEKQKDDIVFWGLILAAIGPILIIIGKMSIGLGALVKVLVFARNAMVLFNAVVAANPISMVVIAIGAVIGGFVWLIRSSSETARKVRNFFASMANGVIAGVNAIIDGMNKINPFKAIKRIEPFVLEAKKIEDSSGKASKGVKEMNKEIKKIEGLKPPTMDLDFKPTGGTKTADVDDRIFDGLTLQITRFKKEVEEIPKTVGKIDFEKTLANPFTGALGIMGDQIAIFLGVDVVEFENSIGDMATQLGDNLAQGAESFGEFVTDIKGMMKDVIGALISQGVAAAVANAMASIPPFPGSVFLIPIIAGAAAGLARTAFNSLIPAFEKGGIVTGPTMGLIGEAGPEAVIPLNKLNQFTGGGSQNIVVTGKIIGNDIWLSNEKTQFNRQRTS